MRTVLTLLAFAAAAPAGRAADYLQWRGPNQTGEVNGAGLPDSFDLDAVGKNDLLWKADVGGRSAPLLMGGKLFILNGFDNRKPTEGERVSCLNANTGKTLWEHKLNVYHADVVTSRLGWTTIAGDAANGRLYTHTTSGALMCFDTAGKVLWQRQLTEEFGRFTGYGGRIVSPVFDSGLVIVAIVGGSWGDNARGSNRFLAFDGASGEVVWISDPDPFTNYGTYQSTPVVAVINGQRLLIAGGASGALHALKVRTGERVWSYPFSTGAINPSPVVDGNLVYGAHGEENIGGGPVGRVVCLDASQIDPATKRPKLVWDFRRSNRFGLSHPALADGRLYVPDDGAELFCFNAKTGKFLWKERYGTTSRGAPMIADGKLYVFDVNAKLTVFTLNGDKKPANKEEFTLSLPPGETGFNETQGTPIAAGGRLYFTTSFDTYCVGPAKEKPAPPFTLKLAPETPFDPAAKPAGLRVYPFETSTKPGATVTVKVIPVDANGRDLPPPAGFAPEWSIVGPSLPKPPAAAPGAAPPMSKDGAPPVPAPGAPAPAGPPLLKGVLKPAGATATVTVDATPGQGGYLEVKAGGLTGRARVRVVPQIPYANDFEKVPVGAVPGGWVNTQGKFAVKQLADGSKVLSKLNTDGRPPLAKANAYVTLPESAGYTLQCDLYATLANNKLPDMGVVVDRYSMVFDGKPSDADGKRTVRLISWEARPRINVGVSYDWKPDTWYTAKLSVAQAGKTARVLAKVWERGQPEPAAWTVEHEDVSPNRNGAAALYGYVSNIDLQTGTAGSDIYYDNLTITPDAKK